MHQNLQINLIENYIEYNPFSTVDGEDGCLTGIVLSDPDAEQIPVEEGDCIDMPEPLVTTLELGAVNEANNSIEVWVTTPDSLAGFQFEVTGFTMVNVYGGIAEEYGYTLSNSENIIINVFYIS